MLEYLQKTWSPFLSELQSLVIQHSYLAKHLQKIACSSPLHVPVLNGDDSIKNEKYKLLATVNHTGSLDRGHYTAYIRRQQDSWLHCNDAAVVLSEESKVNNDSSYVYFYEKI